MGNERVIGELRIRFESREPRRLASLRQGLKIVAHLHAALRHRARKATEQKTAQDVYVATMRRKTICEGCPALRLGEVRIERWCSLADERPGQPHDCAHGRYSRWTARLTNLATGKCPAGKWS